MDNTYELWDVAAGNIVGSFPSPEEGLSVVWTLLETYGRNYADELSLSHRVGTRPSVIVAVGEQPIKMVDGLSSKLTDKTKVPTPAD